MAATSSPRRILLIVDDDEDFLDLLAMRLGKRFRLLLAHDGEEALAKVAEQKPDLVLLDVMMPRLGGWSVCWTLKNHEDYNKIPILFLTAVGTSSQSVKSQLSRGDDYLLKPFSMEMLDQKIDNLLQRPAVS